MAAEEIDGRRILIYSVISVVLVIAAVTIAQTGIGRSLLRSFGIYWSTPQETCQNNLRQISGATDQYALDNSNVGPTNFSDICGPALYIKSIPVCPKGGIYTIPKLGDDATCTIPGHTI